MYCPNCKTEYREGFRTCADCETALVSIPPPESFGIDEQLKPADWQYLLTASDDIEAAMIASFLDGEDIPVFKKPIGAGAYLQTYLGQTRHGIKIFVPNDCLEEARETIEAYRETELDDSIDDDFDDDEYDFMEKCETTRFIGRAFIWFLIVPAVVAVVFTLISLIDNLR